MFGIIIALTMPVQYQVDSSIVPEQTSTTGLASIASMMGVSMNGMESQDAIDPSMFPDISTSTPFLLNLSNVKVRTLQDTTLVAFRDYLKTEYTPWYVKVTGFPAKVIDKLRTKKDIPSGSSTSGDNGDSRILFIDRKTGEMLMTLSKSISVSQNAKTGVITVKASFQDPMVTLMMTDAIITQLQQSIYDYKTTKARAELADLQALEQQRRQEYETHQRQYADYVSRNRSANNEIINVEKNRLESEMGLAYQALQQVSSQRYLSEQSLIERKPSYAMLNPPTFPIEPSGSKKMVIILWFILGFIISAGWILWGRRWYREIYRLLAEAKGKKATMTHPEE